MEKRLTTLADLFLERTPKLAGSHENPPSDFADVHMIQETPDADLTRVCQLSEEVLGVFRVEIYIADSSAIGTEPVSEIAGLVGIL